MKPYVFTLPEWFPNFLSARPIFSYGIMLGISFLVGWSISAFLAEKNGLDKKKTGNALFWAMVGSILGARIFYFFGNLEELTLKNFFSFQKGGLVAYGGYIGGILAGLFYCVIKKFPFLEIADMTAPQLALGLGITRIGCFLYGCDFGVRSSLPWAIKYPKWDLPNVQEWIGSGSPAWVEHLNKGIVSLKSDVSSLPIHPAQLYESLAGFIFFLILYLYLPFRKFKGQLLFLFILFYGIFRFFNEFLRGEAGREFSFAGIAFTSQSQFIAFLTTLISIFCLIYYHKKTALKSASVSFKKYHDK